MILLFWATWMSVTCLQMVILTRNIKEALWSKIFAKISESCIEVSTDLEECWNEIWQNCWVWQWRKFNFKKSMNFFEVEQTFNVVGMTLFWPHLKIYFNKFDNVRHNVNFKMSRIATFFVLWGFSSKCHLRTVILTNFIKKFYFCVWLFSQQSSGQTFEPPVLCQ